MSCFLNRWLTNSVFALTCGSVGLSASSALAHGVWIYPQPSGTSQRVMVSFADGPEPGSAALMDAKSETQAFVVTADGRKPVNVTRFSSGDMVVLSGKSDAGEAGIKELEVIFTPPVRVAGRAGVEGQRSEGRGAGGGRGEGGGRAEGGGRVESGGGGGRGEGGSRGGRGGGPRGEEGEMGSSRSAGGENLGSSKSIFFGKYLQLTKGEAVKSKANEAMKVDFLPEWDGEKLQLTVLDGGAPAEATQVSIKGPDLFQDRQETEQGAVEFAGMKPGRYKIEVRIVPDAQPTAENGQPPVRVTYIGTLVLDLQAEGK